MPITFEPTASTYTTDAQDVDGVDLESPTQGTSGVSTSVPQAQLQSTGSSNAPTLDTPTVKAQGSMGELIFMLTKLQSDQMNSSIKSMTKSVQQNVQEKSDKYMERAKELIKSRHAAKKSHKGGMFAKVFGWIGEGLGLLAAGAMIATGVGSAAGVALAAVMITLIVAQTVVENDKALQAKMQKAFGDKGMMAFSIALAATTLVVGIAAAVLTGGAAAGEVVEGVEGIEEGIQMTKMGAETAETVDESVNAGETASTVGSKVSETVETVKDTAQSLERTEEALENIEEVADNGTKVKDIVQTGEQASDEAQGADETAEESSNIESKAAKAKKAAKIVKSAATITKSAGEATVAGDDMHNAKFRKEMEDANSSAKLATAAIKHAAALAASEQQLIKDLIKKLEECLSGGAQLANINSQTSLKIMGNLQTAHTA